MLSRPLVLRPQFIESQGDEYTEHHQPNYAKTEFEDHAASAFP
jgi:hypothetical protein